MLEEAGATVRFADHQAARSVRDAATELATEIDRVVAETGAERVNLIAHSKGGVDSRYAITLLGRAPKVASLTTISTPHHGTGYAALLMRWLPWPVKQIIQKWYPWLFRKRTGPAPDLLSLGHDMSPEVCAERNRLMPDAPGVLYRSTGSALALRRTDGVVPTSSMRWTGFMGIRRPRGLRGISHADIVDIAQHDVGGFYVCDFYRDLVMGLKEVGL
jgi:triacylglycerol lipase